MADGAGQQPDEPAASPAHEAGSPPARDDEELLDVVSTASLDGADFSEDEEYFRPIKRLCMLEAPANPSPKPLTSFFIKDILSHKPARRASGIVRPWDLESASPGRRRPRSTDEDSRSESDSADSPAAPQQHSSTSPLDALFEMTSKAFEGLESGDRTAGESLYTHTVEAAAVSVTCRRPKRHVARDPFVACALRYLFEAPCPRGSRP